MLLLEYTNVGFQTRPLYPWDKVKVETKEKNFKGVQLLEIRIIRFTFLIMYCPRHVWIHYKLVYPAKCMLDFKTTFSYCQYNKISIYIPKLHLLWRNMQQHFSAVNFNVIQFKRKTKIYIQDLFLLLIENRTLKLTYSVYVGTENICTYYIKKK